MTNEQTPQERLAARFLNNDYHDRGMMKWQGFYLSDHTSVLSKKAQAAEKRRVQVHQTAMTAAEIEVAINQAIVKHRAVVIDKAERDREGLIPQAITGKIEGWYERYLIINAQMIAVDEIYAIQVAE